MARSRAVGRWQLCGCLLAACTPGGDAGSTTVAESSGTADPATGVTGVTGGSGEPIPTTGLASTTASPGTSSSDLSDTAASTTATASSGDRGESGASSSTGAAAPAFVLRPITAENRHYETMHGGWGPHLRGLMRAADDALWFTVDAGEDVYHNRKVRYFRRGADEAQWSEQAENLHAAGIQQNAASLLLGDLILTYGVDIAAQRLEECYLDTTDISKRACNTVLISGVPYQTPQSSNYVGAAVLGAGWRIVWWTVVGENGGEGAFYYTYNYGGGWNGPVASGLAGANDLGYVHAMATAEGGLALAGQTFTGKYPDGSYHAVVAEVTPGQPLVYTILADLEPGVEVRTAADLWQDRDSGAVHVVATTQTGGLRYYHRPPGAAWAGHALPLHSFADGYRARFVRPAGEPLHLVVGSASGSGVTVLRAPDVGVDAAIDWGAAVSFAMPEPGPGFAAPSALYVESRSYQERPVGGLGFAICGAYQVSDEQIWEVTLE
ncbi:hypothetical protein [Nannocystis sp.]|uniref:hypothetical protein n=1 Tax=Nannocystis sp. TaxID=1962667 RepID=UPI0025EBB15C|nr:hypothetical protein [Nannocystis sp.]MBK7827547.1 hypothetical protein [Nannocystis sp.]